LYRVLDLYRALDQRNYRIMNGGVIMEVSGCLRSRSATTTQVAILGQSSRSQQASWVIAISQKTMKGISLNFGHKYIWFIDVLIRFWGQHSTGQKSWLQRFLWLLRGRGTVPPQTRAASSILTFRRETKSHLFSQSFG